MDLSRTVLKSPQIKVGKVKSIVSASPSKKSLRAGFWLGAYKQEILKEISLNEKEQSKNLPSKSICDLSKL